MNSIIVIIYTLTYIIHITFGNYTECGYKDEDGTIWDLTPLSNLRSDNFYTLPDGASPDTETTFFVNFCNNISAIPPVGNCAQSSSQVCIDESSDGTTCNQFATRPQNTLTHGYVAFTDGSCYATAGGDRESFVDPEQLIEYSVTETAAGKALQIRYNYGDYCNITGSAANRELTIWMVCDESITEIEQGTQIISADPDGCDSQLSIASIYGCPVVNVNVSDIPSTTDFDITDNTMDTTQAITTTEDEYSISGKWCKYDENDNEIFGVKIGVNLDCTKIKFILYSPANNTWFAFGVGGNYIEYTSLEASSAELEDSEDFSEADVMNGYAIISTGTGVDDVYESNLESGVPPARQEADGGMNDLDCEITENDGVRYVECLRDYDTGDENDFYKFFVGVNDLIYAYGPIASNGELLQHGENMYGYGDAHVSYIYMKQEYGADLCGFAKDYDDDSDEPSDAERMWMIIGIVFICLFAVMCGIVIYLCWRLKDKDVESAGQRGTGGYQQTGNTDDMDP